MTDQSVEGGISLHKKFKTPFTITEKWSTAKKMDNKQAVWSYLTAKKSLFKISGDVQSHFRITKTETDALGMTHVRLQEVVNGIPVYGSQQTIHLGKDGSVQSYFGQYIPALDQSQSPKKTNSPLQPLSKRSNEI
jgi:bacillolysin